MDEIESVCCEQFHIHQVKEMLKKWNLLCENKIRMSGGGASLTVRWSSGLMVKRTFN